MPKPQPDMTGRTHGIGGYNYGCRCDVCKNAKAVKRKEYQSSKSWEYQKRYRQRLKEQDPQRYAEILRRDNERRKAKLTPEFYRWQAIYKKYKMTQAMYEGLLSEQNGVCAICKNPPKKNYLAVDHDHDCCPSTKTCGNCIRGLLCGSCNSFLGRVNDNAESLLDYLKKYPKEG